MAQRLQSTDSIYRVYLHYTGRWEFYQKLLGNRAAQFPKLAQYLPVVEYDNQITAMDNVVEGRG